MFNKKLKEVQNLTNQLNSCDANIKQKTKAIDALNTTTRSLKLDLKRCESVLETTESVARMQGSLQNSIDSKNFEDMESELNYTKGLLERCQQITSDQYTDCANEIKQAVETCDQNVQELKELAIEDCEALAARTDSPVCSSKTINTSNGPVTYKKTFKNRYYLNQSGRIGDEVQDGACDVSKVSQKDDLICSMDYQPYCGLVRENNDTNTFIEKDFVNACEARLFNAATIVPGECSKYCSLNNINDVATQDKDIVV